MHQSGLAIVACLWVAGHVHRAEAADLYVPAQYSTIQQAVDAAADADTVHIAAGVYQEQILIRRKSLILEGQPGAILRAFPDMEDLGFGWRNILLIQLSTHVTLRGLTFEGDQLADMQVRGSYGVYYVDSGGTVEHCRFSGFREQDPGEIGDVQLFEENAALVFYNDLSGAPRYEVQVTGNTIVDSYRGILLRGTPDPGQISLDFVIQDNLIQGIGGAAVNLAHEPIGIRIQQGASGAVIGNTVSDFSLQGDRAAFANGFGIAAVGSTPPPGLERLALMHIEDNTLRNNTTHLLVIKGDGHQILNNYFEGAPEEGWRRVGFMCSGTNLTVEGNEFRDVPTGILALGDDPELGTNLGIAIGAQIQSNRFCEVAVPVSTQAQAVVTENGSLFCPYPAPVLTAETATLLCWPEYEVGVIVQSAPTLEGPWMEVNATRFVQGDSLCVALPNDAGQKFFRLIQP